MSAQDLILGRLTRVSSKRLIPEIDSFRFFAILFVLLLHVSSSYEKKTIIPFSPNLLSDIANKGMLGVMFFFTISGFIIAKPFAEYHRLRADRVDLKRYFLRRLTRLEPPFILYLTGNLLLNVLFGLAAFHALLPHYLAGLVYQNSLIYRQFSPILPPAWSLEVEAQFYLLAPLLTFVFAIPNPMQRRTVLLCSIAGGVILKQVLPSSSLHFINLTLLGNLSYFLTGFLLLDLFLFSAPKNPGQSVLWDILSCVGWFGGFALSPGTLSPVENAILCALIFLAYYGSFRGQVWNRIVRNRWIVAFGGMCYTTYLSHSLMIAIVMNRFFVRHLTVSHNFVISYVIQLIIFIALIFLLSVPLYLLFERPFMDFSWPTRLKRALGAQSSSRSL